MKFRVISNFKDSTDNDYVYHIDDEFPRKDRDIEEISKKRLEELTTTKNKKGKILIIAIETESDTDNKNSKKDDKVKLTKESQTEKDPEEIAEEPEAEENPETQEDNKN